VVSQYVRLSCGVATIFRNVKFFLLSARLCKKLNSSKPLARWMQNGVEVGLTQKVGIFKVVPHHSFLSLHLYSIKKLGGVYNKNYLSKSVRHLAIKTPLFFCNMKTMWVPQGKHGISKSKSLRKRRHPLNPQERGIELKVMMLSSKSFRLFLKKFGRGTYMLEIMCVSNEFQDSWNSAKK
jgi:hypothetical protein